MKFSISELDDQNVFLERWSALCAAGAHGSFFQSPAWMAAWLGGAPSDSKLYEIRAEKSGENILLGGFCVRPASMLRGASSFLNEFGIDALDTVYIEYNDFLIEANIDAKRARTAALQAMVNALSDVETFVFRNVTKAVRDEMTAFAEEMRFSCREPQVNPVFACALNHEVEFIDGLSKSLRAKIRRSIRRYEERGAIALRRAETQEEQATAWQALSDLHQAAWRARGHGGAFSNPNFVAFHDRLRAIANDKVDLLTLTAGDETIGVLYNFLEDDAALNYQSGFKFEDDNQLVPGFVAHMLAAERYRSLGLQQYNLLAGEADYKRRLGKHVETLHTIVMERPTIRNHLRGLARGLKARLRA